jgi:WW domain
LLEDRATRLTETLGPKVGPVEIQSLIGRVRGQMELTERLLAEQPLESDSETELAEVHEYAEYLGIDVAADPELLFVAKYAAEADVPPEWTACLDESGKEYFCNLKTGETQYQHPMDPKYVKMYQSLKGKKTAATRN